MRHWLDKLCRPDGTLEEDLRLLGKYVDGPILDAHVMAYERYRPTMTQFKACDKVWEAHRAGKMTEDQAIEAWYRTVQRQDRQMGL